MVAKRFVVAEYLQQESFEHTQNPDSMTTLGQRSFSVVDSVGPTLETDVGTT